MAGRPAPAASFVDMSIEELLNVQVTSVSKKPERLASTAGAVHVVTGEDIRRSGAMSLPEALRLVPGVNVAQINAGSWAVSIRGFNGRFANKLLVLMDGRSIYTPLFSGVFWDAQDTLLEDIERIEVICGPGAAVWGANAVNGVINIVTKSAKATLGGSTSVVVGTEEQGTGSVRYGAKINDETFFRLFYKYVNRDRLLENPAFPAADHHAAHRGGFRLDWEPSDVNSLSLSGDLYSSRVLDPNNAGQLDASGGHLLGRWNRTLSDSDSLAFQFYYDRAGFDGAALSERRNTFDVEARHRFALGERHDLNWGVQYRFTGDESFGGSGALTLMPPERHDQLVALFVQDQITLLPERLTATLGVRLEHNDYTGVEVQPSARLAWTPSEKQTFWAALSRAVRTPSRAESSLVFNTPASPPATPPGTVLGNPQQISESLHAYELGWRIHPVPTVSFDVAAFYNKYDHLQGSVTTVNFVPFVSTTTRLDNQNRGSTYGGEVAMSWQALENWRLMSSYTLLQMHTTAAGVDGSSPQQQVQIQSRLDLPARLELDTGVAFVDALPALGVSHYVRLDARLGWRARKDLALSLGIKNALDARHREFGNEILSVPTESQRSVYVRLDAKF